jgi:phage terminase large subunit GpA-like protein
VVLFDEVGGYPLDVDGEGDPVAIGTRRTDGYADYKIVKGSTPAKPKGISPIERDFLRSDMRRFFVPCPFCGLLQVRSSFLHAKRGAHHAPKRNVSIELDITGANRGSLGHHLS